jgi:hypothetical protein
MANRKKYAAAHELLANEWLYACPAGTPTPQIAAALDIAGQPVTEVSARHWQQDWRMANDLMEAYGYPKTYWFRPGRPVGWDGLEDWVLIKTWQHGPMVRGNVTESRFVGELVVIRESQAAAENTLAFLLDIIQAHVIRSLKDHSRARIAVVLEGWERPTVEGRVRRRVGWLVNRLT